MNIPYYLDPNSQNPPFGTIDIFASVPVPEKSPTGIWEDLSSSVNSAGDWIWDSANGVWVSAKEALVSVGTGIGSTVGEAFSFLGKGIDWWLTRLAFIAGGLLLFIWVLGKSGGFDAIAKGAGAFLALKGR